jgi:hypothetical protein
MSSDLSADSPNNNVTKSTAEGMGSLKIHTGSSVLISPFFLPNTQDGLMVERSLLLPEPLQEDEQKVTDPESVLSILDQKMTGDPVKAIYRDIKDHDHGFTVNNWTFLSANEIRTNQHEYNDKFFDIAVRYNGLGWIVVLAYIPETNNFFFRHDGGSNGYDRDSNYDQYIAPTYIPAQFPMSQSDPSGESKFEIEVQYTYSNAMLIISNNWIL